MQLLCYIDRNNYITFQIKPIYTIQLNLNFTYTCVCMFTTCKPFKFGMHTYFACNFGVRTLASKHMQYMSDARHKLALALPHNT